jgi:hypothetical protein
MLQNRDGDGVGFLKRKETYFLGEEERGERKEKSVHGISPSWSPSPLSSPLGPGRVFRSSFHPLAISPEKQNGGSFQPDAEHHFSPDRTRHLPELTFPMHPKYCESNWL